MATKHNPEKGPSLNCEAWEAMLADALDGTLEARDAAAFAAHSTSCAGCGELLEEAKRGSEWLRFLRQTPETPDGLLEKILAGTAGADEVEALVPAGAAALPQQPWLGVSMAMLHRHAAGSRLLMTMAMAFFSIALTLNLTGVRLNQLKLSDLKPSTLASSVSHQYFTTSAHLMRYYANLRFVYEVESRLNDIRHATTQDTNQSAPQNNKPASAPQQQAKPQPSGTPGGSARKGSSSPQPQPARRLSQPPVSVLAICPLHSLKPPAHVRLCQQHGSLPYPGNTNNPSERSLV